MVENVTYVCANESCSRFGQEFRGPSRRMHRAHNAGPLRCSECRKIPRVVREEPFVMPMPQLRTPPPILPPWKVALDRNIGAVELQQENALVRLAPDDAREVGERMIDAAWNLDGKMFHLDVANRRFSFVSHSARAAFRSGVEAMGGTCREVE